MPARARHGGRRGPAQRAARHDGAAAASHDRQPAGRGHRLSQPSFADACRYLFARQAGRIKWSLGPTRALLDALGHPERHFPAIHVGGTNGKGSVCAFIATELEAQGFRAGLYTSPHLVSPCERIVVNGVQIAEDAFATWTDELRPHIERADASFFEAVTAMAFADFAARGVDVAVVEVGLGGRLDATNVITPLVSVVTKIALDHADYLGTDLRSIAREKAGIAKPGVPFVIGEQDPEIRAELVQAARELRAGKVVEVNTEGLAADLD
ncbi:MAG TPA: Mur ligase family protein, partial [Gemmatimonadales bacterium]|nr:Mur ligase family protein [Gemmatimonadales bacterium]